MRKPTTEPIKRDLVLTSVSILLVLYAIWVATLATAEQLKLGFTADRSGLYCYSFVALFWVGVGEVCWWAHVKRMAEDALKAKLAKA